MADFYVDVAMPMLLSDINEMLADPFLNSGYEIYNNFGEIFQMAGLRDFIGNETAFQNLSMTERTASRKFIEKILLAEHSTAYGSRRLCGFKIR